MAVKIYGVDLKLLEEKADAIMSVMGKIRGVQDLGIFRVIGHPFTNAWEEKVFNSWLVSYSTECSPPCVQRA